MGIDEMTKETIVARIIAKLINRNSLWACEAIENTIIINNEIKLTVEDNSENETQPITPLDR